MPRTCSVCKDRRRPEIEAALVAGEPLRNIAKRVSVSPAALFRHKTHAAQAIVKAQERREEKSGLDLLAEAERVRQKAWQVLGRLEAEGDNRGSVVALRECRECLETLGNLLSRATGSTLADLADAAILQEAERRKLKMPVDIRVVYDRTPQARETKAPGPLDA